MMPHLTMSISDGVATSGLPVLEVMTLVSNVSRACQTGCDEM